MTKNNFKPLNGTSFDLLAETVGLKIASALCEHFGGTKILVPKLKTGACAQYIITALGEVDAEKVFAACPIGDEIYIPRKPFGGEKRKQVTLFYVRKRIGEGASTREIAKELGVTDRAVRNYRTKIGLNLPPGYHRRTEKPDQSNSNALLTHHASEKPTNTSKPNKNAP